MTIELDTVSLSGGFIFDLNMRTFQRCSRKMAFHKVSFVWSIGM